MTAIDKHVAESFRAVRWAENGGEPFCASCHDGNDLKPGYRQLKRHPGLRFYYCSACKRQFSDLTGSDLNGGWRPLSLWAFLILGGDPGIVAGRGMAREDYRKKLRKMKARIATMPMAPGWRADLEQRGITAERLLPSIQRDWQAPASNVLGKGGKVQRHA